VSREETCCCGARIVAEPVYFATFRKAHSACREAWAAAQTPTIAAVSDSSAGVAPGATDDTNGAHSGAEGFEEGL
jgi:hypothetical protein